MWARVLGYAAGVLGAACLGLLLGSSPAAADEAPAPADRGGVGSLLDTTRTTVDTAARPVRDAAPAPVKRVVDRTTETVDRVAAPAEQAADRPVRQTVRDTVAAVTDHTETPADQAPEPAPQQAQPPTQQVEHRLPVRALERVEHRPRNDHRAATADQVASPEGSTAGLATAPSAGGSGSPAAAPGPVAPALLLDDPAPSDTSGPSSGGGPGAAADAVDRVVLAAPEGVALLTPARSRAVVPPASSPGFSPD